MEALSFFILGAIAVYCYLLDVRVRNLEEELKRIEVEKEEQQGYGLPLSQDDFYNDFISVEEEF